MVTDHEWIQMELFSRTTSSSRALPGATDVGEKGNLMVNAVWIINSSKS